MRTISCLTGAPRVRRMRALTCACLSVLYGFSQSAQAAEPAEDTETIVVTGSRISNPNVISPTPISTISAEAIKSTGAINIGDILTRMPQLATSFTMGNSSQFIGTAGLALQDLRNLGSERTLVLVNGRRFVGSSAGSTAVDTNLIPANWVERIEIITGGASAVYGADAVTGVVNFILKKNYQGFDINAQYNDSEAGFEQRSAALTGGMSFAEDNGNVAFSLERSEQDRLEFRDRFGKQSYANIRTPDGPTDRRLIPDAGSYFYNYAGTFTIGSYVDPADRYTFNPDGSVRPQRFSGPYDEAGICQDCDRADPNFTNQLQPDYERTSLSSVASYGFSENHRLYFEGTHSEVRVVSLRDPSFNPADNIILPDNAYVTPELAALMGGFEIYVGRDDLDAGRRGEDTTRKTSRVVVGMDGFIGEDWAYDGSVVYGRTRELRNNLNNRIVERFYAAIDAVRDPATNQIVCRTTLDPQSLNPHTGAVISDFGRTGCVPTSLFGEGAINAAARNWFNTTTTTQAELTQFVAGGSLTNNSLFAMPMDVGDASLALGVEFRRETSEELTDPLDRAGLTFLNAIENTKGHYDVKEGYAQFGAPLLKDLEWVQNLSFDAAVRFSEYNTIGKTTAWRYGLDWALNNQIRLRGTRSSAVRAPNISELFSGLSQNFFNITDPCAIDELPNAPDAALRAANCAALGLPADFDPLYTSNISGVSGGNPELEPEEGETWTYGAVITPEFLPDAGLTVDFWNIKLTDAIAEVSGNDTVARCVDSPNGINNIYCANVRRDSTGKVVFISTLSQNIAARSTRGVDVGAYYSTGLGGGDLRLNLDATKVFDYVDFPFQEDPQASIESKGTLGFPEWKAMFGASYKYGGWAFNWNQRYFSDMLRVSNESYAANPRQTTPIRAGAGWFSDVRGSYRFEDGLETYLGVTNVFDKNPPVGLFGTGFGSALYDAMGRSYFAGVNYRFE